MVRIPLGAWVETVVDWMVVQLAPVFDFLTWITGTFVEGLDNLLAAIPVWLFILLIAAIALVISRWTISLFSAIGFYLIYNMGYWDAMLDTLALVMTSVLISVVFGIPLGIWMSQSNRIQAIFKPVLDFMQTMPAFVYLIPSILFFGIGLVPGIISSVIFSMPPAIRLTNLGIRQVPADLLEAANAFGSTRWQKLFKVQLPLALPSIMAGINQCIMLALSMVVTASLVGAPGLGADVYRAVTQIKIGVGFEAGLAIVILAIILDRISHQIGMKNTERRHLS